jgi:hypothetical protein
MKPLRTAVPLVVSSFLLGLVLHELNHLYQYGHLAPLGLHVDVVVTSSSDLVTVEGATKIYDARLTNDGILPARMKVCDYVDSGGRETRVDYVVERWDAQTGQWTLVPAWDDSLTRWFCRPSFEVAGEHVTSRWLWPGQSIWIGQVIPPEREGFHIGDDGRFTVSLGADGNWINAISTSPFRVEQQMKSRATTTRTKP